MTVRSNGLGIRKGGKLTDNTNLSHKQYLRRLATSGIDRIRVLDLFAGDDKCWSGFDCELYTGVDIDATKGRGVIHGDNRRIIPTLDLSKYNVIDCDSYGVPANQIRLLYENGTMKSGTVVIYTCIANKVSAIPKTLQDYAGFSGDMYRKAETLFNGHAIELFFSYLAALGVRTVMEYEEPPTSGYTKKYGFFIV